jgi:hypothetical protein
MTTHNQVTETLLCRSASAAHGRNQAMSELILGAEVSDSAGSGEKEG